MTREEKEKQVAWLREQFQGARAMVLTEFQGLSVAEITKLRSELRSRGISYKVLKNTLARLAYKDTDIALLGPDLAGPRAAAWAVSDDDVPVMAKILADFAKGHPKFHMVRGVLGGKIMHPEEVEILSKLPSREELLSRVLGTMMAPVSAFVNTLAAIPRQFLYVLKAIEEQKGAPSEPAEG